MKTDLLILIIFFILGPVLRGFFGQKKSRRTWEQRRPRLPQALPEIEQDFLPAEKVDTERPKTIRDRRYVRKSISENEKVKVNEQWPETIYEQGQAVKGIPYSKQIYSDVKSQTISTHAPKKTASLLKKDNLLYGIIMKEVLSPPKALSRKDRLT
jgi:hypothetical protein